LGREGFEQLLGFHAAPMLMGLKTASLLSFQKSRFDDFEALLAGYQQCFTCKGISVFRLSEGEEYVLLLFYREGALRQDLAQPAAKKILGRLGYRDDDTLMGKLEYLKMRMQLRKSFPHEVGLFLGYPPEDVAGFIQHKGQDFVCSGCWKVYANERETRALFELYAECTHDFCLRLEAGERLPDLVKAV
jgi:hypothetical protein